MQQLPGIEIVKRSYRFLSEDFRTIVRLAWFPLLIVSIVQYFVAREDLLSAIRLLEAGDIMGLAMGQPQWRGLISALFAIAGGAIVAVAIHRVVLFGDRKPGTFIYFAFGKVELLFVILPLIVGIVLLVVLGTLYASALGGGGSPNIAMLILFIAILAGFVFVAVRLAPLWPIAVVEERYLFREAWDLSRNNFWRLFGTFLLGLLPFVVVLLLVTFVIQGSLFSVRSIGDLIAAFQRILDLQPIQAVITYVLTILISAMSVALLSYSYKALKGYGPDDLVPQ